MAAAADDDDNDDDVMMIKINDGASTLRCRFKHKLK